MPRKEGDVNLPMTRFLLMTLGVALLVLPSRARADGTVEVRLIYAEKSEKASVEPKLKDLEKTFSRFSGYNAFSFLDGKKMPLKLGETGSLMAPGGKKIDVTYRGMSKGFIKLRFKMGEFEMNVRVHNGGVFFHGGYKHKEGRVIVAIRARGESKAAGPDSPPVKKK